MVVYRDNVRPRVLIQGIQDTHPFASVIEKYSGTVKYYDEDPEIRWESWDAVISLDLPKIPPNVQHLRVMQFGGDATGYVDWQENGWASRAIYMQDHIGDEIDFPQDAIHDEELRLLVKDHLLPLVEAGDPRRYRYKIAPPTTFTAEGTFFWPLLRDLDGYAIAALYRPAFGPVECFYLPADIDDLTPWLLYAFKRWSAELPDIFPARPEWTSDAKWMTQREEEAHSTLIQKKLEADAAIAAQRMMVVRAEQAVVEARESSDVMERPLLTGEGDLLVNAVQRACEAMGFTVRNLDAELAEGQARREDLWVSDGNWTAVCEIKGYAKGAKASDLARFTKFKALYVQETRKLPDALWYVVNHFRNSDPSSRPVTLVGAEDFLEVFAEEPGLVVDTCDLFLLQKAVANGSVDQAAARQHLAQSTGRFNLSRLLQAPPTWKGHTDQRGRYPAASPEPGGSEPRKSDG